MKCYTMHGFAFYWRKIDVNSSDIDRGDLRLVGGTSWTGKLQMKMDGVWTSLCSFGFSSAAAGVACSQLGLGSVGIVHTDGRLV